MPWRPWDEDGWSRPKPIAAKGGIRAQSKRGRFGESWWAERWIAVLESFDIGSRLQRGRSYARRGQVLTIDVKKGLVTARVQGSRRDPYDVAVKIRRLTPAEWERVADRISGQAIFAAKLLAGEMPRDIEEAFAAAGVSLFPGKSRELETACSCPDWSNPCKHVAAVYYLLGEEFDRDPFLLFRLRGLDRDQLMDLLDATLRSDAIRGDVQLQAESGQGAAPATTSRGRRKKAPARAPSDAPPPQHPLVADPTRFWQAPALPANFHGAVERPQTHAAIGRRLGRFPFWRGETPLAEALEPTFASASQRALELFVAAAPETTDAS